MLGVSAGAVTAAQLAGVAVSAAADGRQIDGMLVADPDPADQTTGRVPQLARPARRRMPTRLTGHDNGDQTVNDDETGVRVISVKAMARAARPALGASDDDG